MRRFILSLIAFFLSLANLGAEEGFVPLFNGKDLSGWSVVNGDGKFSVEGGEIVGTGINLKSNTFLRTDRTYKNFDFRFEMKFDDLTGNSGMMFRGLQKTGKDGRVNGYQCEHDNGKTRAWTAGLYDEARRGWLMPPAINPKNTPEQQTAQKAFTLQGQKIMRWNDWNQIRIRCEDNHIQIWLNGEMRVDYRDQGKEFTPEGFFALQVHSGKSCHVRWRNIQVKEL
ncbi:MAG: 3-keto-disaccharide hydrolase [Akkermansiaceae bacterium]